MAAPETRYTKTSDGTHLAYQVVGKGATDFVFVSSAWGSDIEGCWQWEVTRDLYTWLASRGRLVLFDRRGAGMSDPLAGQSLPTLEVRMQDIRTVLDAVGIERAVLVSIEDGGAECFLFAATYPERTAALVAECPTSRGTWAPDAPWQWTEAKWAEWMHEIEADFGSKAFVERMVEWLFPSRIGDAVFAETWGSVIRHALSPGAALAAERINMETDARHVLPLIQAPTLVIHFVDDRVESVEEARSIAAHIPGAVLLEVPGNEHIWWPGTPPSAKIDQGIERFLASLRAEEAEFDRVLATVLFTDIVGSTSVVAELGDDAWKELVERHHATVRALLGRYRGHEVDTAGDGFFATFDGPARAIRCARAIGEAVRSIGLEVRSGLHTGEVETINDKVGGIAVAIGARVASFAGPSEILVSQTVKDLVAGSGLAFADVGERELKGVPDRWHLYRVVG
ncbi:MAG TPA: adenylate/guanylate cyclase domain-containing protein [Actinomycetota bacterium]